MERARTETAARVRRIVSRTLLVLGGAVAGTATAWLLSAATASASTQVGGIDSPVQVPVHGALDHPVVHNANQVIKHVGDVVHGVTANRSLDTAVDLSDVAGDLDATLHGRRADLVPPTVHELGDQATAAFGEFRDELANRFGLSNSAVGAVRLPGSHDEPPPAAGAPGDTSPVVGPIAHLPSAGLPSAGGHTAPVVDPALRERADMGGLNRGSPHAPALPQPLPFAPMPAPSGPCSCGHSSSASTDGPAFGALPLNGFLDCFASAGRARPALAGASVHTGAQPGRTPD